MSPTLETLLTLTAIGVALLAAAFDAATGTIPNRLTLPVLVAAPLVHGFASGPGALGVSLLAAIGCGVVPLLLFARGGMGGGDVKLFAALGALVGIDAGLRIELSALFVTLFYALALLAWRGLLLRTLLRALRLLLHLASLARTQAPPLDAELTTTVRLGIPIAAATVLTLMLSELVPWLTL